MDFVDNNIQKVQVQPEDQVYARNEDIKVYGKLVSMSTENVVADSEQIWDEALKKNQSDINSQTQSKFGEYLPLTGGNIDGNLYVYGEVGLDGPLKLGDSLHIEENDFAFEGADNESLTINSNGLTYAFTENDSQGFNVKEGDATLNKITIISKDGGNKNISSISPGQLSIGDGKEIAVNITPTSVELNTNEETRVSARKVIAKEVLMTGGNNQYIDRLSITPSVIEVSSKLKLSGSNAQKHQTTINPLGITADSFHLTNGTEQDVLLGDGSVIKLGQPNGVAKLDQGGNIPLENLGNLDTQIALVVDQLPTTGIKTNKIYLVRKNETGEDNTYVEYVYINGSWEKLGEYTPSVDLSNCVKTDEDSKINADVTVNGKLSVSDADIVINSGKLELHSASDGINFVSNEDSTYISKTNGSANEYFATNGSIQTVPDFYTNIAAITAIPVNGFDVTGTPSLSFANNAEGIYYNTDTNTFVAKQNNVYYATWNAVPSKNIADMLYYGIPDTKGVKPYIGKFYGELGSNGKQLKSASSVASNGDVILEDVELPTIQ